MRRNFGYDYFAVHVTGKTSESGIPVTSVAQMWLYFGEKIRKLLSQSSPMQINACVLMCNHYHMLVSAHGRQREVGLRCDLKPFLGQAYDDENFIRPIRHYNDFTNTYKYIYRNPVEAGLVHRVENYEFSSLYSLLGKSTSHFPVIDNMNLIFNPGKVLRWLNTEDGSAMFGATESFRPQEIPGRRR